MIEAIVPRRPVEWVEAQIAWLAEMGAVTMQRSDLPGIGPVAVATITRFGRDHVELRNLIPGVSRPADVV